MPHRLLKHSVIYTTGNILARGLNFIIQVTIWSNLFPPEVYGQVAYCFVFISFMAVILPFGFDAAFMNYYVRKDEKAAYLKNTIVFMMILALAFIGMAFLFRNTLSPLAIRNDSMTLFSLSLAILFFDILNNQGILYLRAENRAVLSVVLQNIEIVIRLILLLLLVSVFSKNIQYILWANAASSLVLFISLIFIMLPAMKGAKISTRIMKELFFFGLPFMVAGLFDRTIELADRRIVGYFMGDEATGLYVASYTVAVLIRLLVYSFNAGWQPYFLREVDKEEGRVKLEKIYLQTGVIFVVIWFLASLWVPELVKIPLGQGRYILHASYWEGIPIIPVIMGAYVMMGLYLLQLPVLYHKNKTGMNAVFMGIGAALNLGLNLVLIPKMGLMGAAIATAVAYTAMALSIRLWAVKRSDIRQKNGKLLLLGAISIAVFLLVQLLDLSLWWKFPVSILYITLVWLIQPVKVKELLKKQ
ncbi:MAG: oligosaccharide flippase family protein [Candidatus Marinimicrobia bacterium]|nr:oligosaccharide flippase family protein [Candidatus Neomarinimicrobiota bacterium]